MTSFPGAMAVGGAVYEASGVHGLTLGVLARTAQRLLLAEEPERELAGIFADVAALIQMEKFFHYRLGEEPRMMRLETAGGVSEVDRRLFGTMRFGELLCGRVAERQERLVVEDLQHSTHPGSDVLRGAGATSYAGFPLLVEDELVGTVAFISERRTHLRDGDVQMIQAVCDQIAIALERARLVRELRASHDRLRDREERLRLALEGADLGTWDVDLGTGEAAWNERHAAMQGYGPGDGTFTVDDWLMRVHADDRASVLAAVERARASGGLLNVEHRTVWASGEERWLAIYGRVSYSESGTPIRFSGVSRDVTDRRRADEALRESEQRLRFFVENAPVALAMFDCEMRYLAVSRRWRDDYRLTACDVIGRSHYDVFPDMPDRWRAFHRRALAGETVRMEEDVFERADGSVQWLHWEVQPWRDATGAIAGIVMFTEDITARKQADAVLRGAHDTFRHLVESSPFGVYVVDTDSRLVYVSAGTQEVFANVRPLLGRDLGEVLRVILPEPFAGETVARFRNTLDTGEPYHARGTTERARDVVGVEAYDWKIERVVLPDGRPGVVCHFYDLSERLRYEDELRQREEELRLAMQAADAGSWRLLPETGEFFASDRALELHGLSAGTPLTRERALACVHPHDRKLVAAAVRRTIATGVPLRTEHRAARLDGSVRWVASHAERRERAGRLELVGLVQDVTARRQAEETLRAREAEEREIALSLQRALLPPRVLSHPFVQVAARYAAGSDALEVGGDWYDAFALADGRVALTVGDVVGSGVEAAAAMGQLRTVLAALAPYHAPDALLEQLDDYLAPSSPTAFVTLCYAIYDPSSGVLEYASAGHPSILAVTPAGEVRRFDAAQTAPLLGRPRRRRRVARVELEPGTLLLLYSDGLIERRGERLDVGLERLEATVAGMARLSVEDACASAMGMLEGGLNGDDVVVLAARVTLASPTGLRAVFPADPAELVGVRRSIRSWLGALDRRPREAPVLIAIGEVCSNAIEHAYGAGDRGQVELRVDLTPAGSLDVCVRDRGVFRSRSEADRTRGRGTAIIEALTEGFERVATSTGTTVSFRMVDVEDERR